ncbi:MAG: ribonuclease III [Thiotrichaceae bacterium]|nr:ribonuclease III [Thiotrichaceae bacterium]
MKKLTKYFDKPFLASINFLLAITHRSAASAHNERLEFLGDSVLGVVITKQLYDLLPSASEGYLSRLRASLVNAETLAEISKELCVGDYIKLGPGELRAGGHRRNSILADALEAIIASVYIEQGMEATTEFILAIYDSRLNVGLLPSEHSLKDPKSRLQEKLQMHGHDIPRYTLLTVTGEAHKQEFKAECLIKSLKIRTEGMAKSRRKAEQNAAEMAYQLVKL